ncbi:hypothetical protein FH972_026245 [Carpinus fangiana]|uniref:Uncharacterized protein n=1 Tax=Carpinus fangiana TaxID=176857 RepID=A0A5N6L3D8_9ROSI|nr:hypothetical protein FH972_026245 [Carpinus fangiana]
MVRAELMLTKVRKISIALPTREIGGGKEEKGRGEGQAKDARPGYDARHGVERAAGGRRGVGNVGVVQVARAPKTSRLRPEDEINLAGRLAEIEAQRDRPESKRPAPVVPPPRWAGKARGMENLPSALQGNLAALTMVMMIAPAAPRNNLFPSVRIAFRCAVRIIANPRSRSRESHPPALRLHSLSRHTLAITGRPTRCLNLDDPSASVRHGCPHEPPATAGRWLVLLNPLACPGSKVAARA